MYSKGISWINDCRIPFVDEKINFDRPRLREGKWEEVYNGGWTFNDPNCKEYNSQGRFPANILVSDDMLNDGVIKSSKKTSGITYGLFPNTIVQQKKYEKDYERGFDDKGTNSRYYDIDKWFDKILE